MEEGQEGCDYGVSVWVHPAQAQGGCQGRGQVGFYGTCVCGCGQRLRIKYFYDSSLSNSKIDNV